MIYLPIPTTQEKIRETAPIWGPFLLRQAKFEGRDPAEMAKEIWGEVTQTHLAVDEETKRVSAVLATQIISRGPDLVGVLHWLSGDNPKLWFGLIEQVERYFREHIGAVAMIGEPRKGWSRLLRRAGYQLIPHPSNPKLALAEKDLLDSSRPQATADTQPTGLSDDEAAIRPELSLPQSASALRPETLSHA